MLSNYPGQVRRQGWSEGEDIYRGLAITQSGAVRVVIDSESLIVDPEVAERYRQKQELKPDPDDPVVGPEGPVTGPEGEDDGRPIVEPPEEPKEGLPTRFRGTVRIGSDRPARSMHQIVEAIIEQLTTIPGSDVNLTLEIDAEVPSGLDKSKIRTLVENANTLGFSEKMIE